MAKDWRCYAERTEVCDWPLCGCDPDANRVIRAIEECFTLTPAPARRPQKMQEPSPTPDAPFLLP